MCVKNEAFTSHMTIKSRVAIASTTVAEVRVLIAQIYSQGKTTLVLWRRSQDYTNFQKRKTSHFIRHPKSSRHLNLNFYDSSSQSVLKFLGFDFIDTFHISDDVIITNIIIFAHSKKSPPCRSFVTLLPFNCVCTVLNVLALLLTQTAIVTFKRQTKSFGIPAAVPLFFC